MVNLSTCIIVFSINICLALSEHAETSKDGKATDELSNGKVVDKVPLKDVSPTTQSVIVISEKSPYEIQKEQSHKDVDTKDANAEAGSPQKEESHSNGLPNEYERVLQRMDIENSVRTGFYLLMTISIGALIFVGWKIFKLRLSRAERKYGVQGDRTTQELAPLPISMEDPDSDDDDQTIFDAHQNRNILRLP